MKQDRAGKYVACSIHLSPGVSDKHNWIMRPCEDIL